MGKFKKKGVVYTAITGNRDRYPVIDEIKDGWDFVCFTSEYLGNSDLWQTIKTVRLYNNAKDSRVYKLNPHKFLSEYDVSVWIDGNMQLRKGWVDHINKCLDKSNITFLKHPENVKGPYNEGQRCISMGKDSKDIINKQLDFYRSEGLPENENVSATGVLIRRHNEIKEFNNLWWSQVNKYSYRDQISLPYARWKTKLKYNETVFNKKNPHWLKMGAHCKR